MDIAPTAPTALTRRIKEDKPKNPIPHNPSHPTEPRMLRRPLLVVSLGNPLPKYKNTLHSAGHTLLSSLQRTLQHPPFAKSPPYGNGYLSSRDDDDENENLTLWQSPSFMNVSGPVVAAAWRTFRRDLRPDRRSEAKLVVVHDELESALGTLKVKVGGSIKGHNGLKSCVASLGGPAAFTRVGVGIGRPASRESGVVAEYVLRGMSAREVEIIGEAARGLVDILKEVQRE